MVTAAAAGAAAAAAPFSTTMGLLAKDSKNAPAKKVQVPKKNNQIKAASSAKKPNPGERKASRKRIQLSNNNALEVAGLGTLEAGTMTDPANAGKMFAVPDHIQDRLRTLEAFKPTQAWSLFRRPHVLLRSEVVDLVSRLQASAADKKAQRLVLTGAKLSGKSIALLQAMTYGLLNDWVVINIPEGQDLTNGNTEYSPIADSGEPMQFAQPTYTLKLLTSIYNANREQLDKLRQEKDWTSTTNQKQAGGTLSELILSAKEADWAWPTFSALWTELTLPGRPPVLLTLDGLSHISKVTEYRDPSFNRVHAHDLTLVGAFVDALSGKTAMPNGGAVIAATSGNNAHRHPSQELVLSQLEAGQAGREVPLPEPYKKGYDDRVYDSLKNSTVLRLDGVTKEDARALMEYWGASGLLRARIDQRTVWEKWALGGHGLVGEMERASLLTVRV
ncbi:small subunit ribosomal protein S29 [Geosmithia morbida]|uniref:Small ribosomal subunit protein mS29 n=1 Tax=Geosmithia morbida TaxID=1094350 RepID=A0A9P4YVJ7_9HYPO|nr:small subunit ribosomal protein S29 [Geosmithia morbida]KAF4123891.1 small subunit ribosomal protein S29 [Geosmithia morbida]